MRICGKYHQAYAAVICQLRCLLQVAESGFGTNLYQDTAQVRMYTARHKARSGQLPSVDTKFMQNIPSIQSSGDSDSDDDVEEIVFSGLNDVPQVSTCSHHVSHAPKLSLKSALTLLYLLLQALLPLQEGSPEIPVPVHASSRQIPAKPQYSWHPTSPGMQCCCMPLCT